MTTIVEDTKLDFADVLLMPKRSTLSSRSNVDLTRSFKFKHATSTYTGLPICAANMDTVGTIEMAKAFKPFNMCVALHKFYDVDTLVEYFSSPNANPHTFYSMGITDEDFEKWKKVSNILRNKAVEGTSNQLGLPFICIDVANGYSRKFVSFVEKMRNETSAVIMAGNVVTPDMVYDLLERGADIVKVGIGPGSVCTTRKLTGVGYPQLSAILECQDAAHGADGLICGDGGIVVPGDVAKAFAAGADFVMCGGIFAGHEECLSFNPSYYKVKSHTLSTDDVDERMNCWLYLEDGNKYAVNTKEFNDLKLGMANWEYIDRDKLEALVKKYHWAVEVDTNATVKYYGMSSHEAMTKHYGGKANYRASEGKVVEIPFKGKVATTIEEMLGGLRSACTYIGARRLKDLPKCGTFVKVNRQTNESLSGYNVG
jgi:GMP reductase